MPALGEILRRFRFHGVPGAPTSVAVPADRTTELEAELAPVFAALEDAQRAAEDALAASERAAREHRSAAVVEAQWLVADARSGVIAARDAAASVRLAEADVECRRVRAEGRDEARRVAHVSAERIDALVDLVVARVLAWAPSSEDEGGVAP